jgi:predicted small lipoprotein YifL
MRNVIRTTIGATMLALLALFALAGCGKQEAPVQAEAAPVPAPKNGDPNAWQAYASDVVKRNMDGVTNNPFVYFLPEETTADFQAQYDSQLEKVQGDITRGILEGNMLAFISPASAKMADLVTTAFTDVEPNAMKGVKVLFIGQPADGERVKAAVAPSGVTYVFVEAK